MSIILALLLLLVAAPSWAATYYVDRNLPGSDSNSGTSESTPFLTIKKCVQVATTPGDTCLVKNGTYTTEGLIQFFSGGTAGAPITLKNYPGHSPKIVWNDPTHTIVNQIAIAPGSTVCNSSPPGYIVIEGLETTGGYSSLKVDCGHHITIRNNHFHDNWYDAILIVAGNNITIDRNSIHHSGDFSGGLGSNGLKHSHNVYVVGQNYTITNNLIYDAYLYDIQLAAKPWGGTPAPNNGLYTGWSGTVSNNTFAYSVTRGAIAVWENGGGFGSTTIENNILYENAQGGGNTAGIGWCGQPAGIVVKNNLHYATSPGATTFTAADCSVTDTCLSCTISGNLVNLSNPNMVNAPSTIPAVGPDFHLQSTSTSAIDTGLNLSSLGVTTDYDGNVRPAGNGYDIGAYEFGSTSGGPTGPAAPKNFRVY